MIRRSRHVPLLPNAVCFPGGGVALNEPPEQAAIREAKEELGATITPLKLVWQHALGPRPINLKGYLATLHPGPLTPDPLEVAEILWLNRDEAVNHPDGLPTNQAFIAALEAG
jgi:8-oxo-dGTP pyrophosphatase MutT (NUDIX family)